MGWWSADILGGDTPLDAVLSLEKAVGWNSEKRGGIEEVATAVAARKTLSSKTGRAKTSALVRRMGKYSLQDGSILAVVHVLLTLGIKPSAEVVEIARKAAREDEWANEGDATRRREVINDFLARLDATMSGGKGHTYHVIVARTSVRHTVIEVQAVSEYAAKQKALAQAGDYDFNLGSERDAKYAVEDVSELEEVT